MKRTTRSLLKRLETAGWFSCVGEPVDTHNVQQVWSWKEAIAVCRSKFAQMVAVESRNVLTEQLSQLAPRRYQRWNELVEPINDVLWPMIRRKTQELIREHRLPKKLFQQAVFWDLSNAGMELEYADVVPPKYFAERVEWYLAGHFPCGWDGDFPEGCLIVF